MKRNFIAAAIVAAFSVAPVAQAAVVNHADVSGLRTFQDTNTGRVWLDLDNFFDASASVSITGNQLIAAANAAGFAFATNADVHQMLDTLPLTGGEWGGYAAVMGYGHPRSLIWGMMDDGNGNPYGWAYAYSTDATWGFADNATDANTVQNGGSAGAVDMGIWAFQTGAAVPEPLSLALVGLGLAGMTLVRRKRDC